ncbi:MAG: cadmium-translocating P-type ATPase [Kofleriaceae bacterium]|nr:cadmium-translocating P-type ATPase [Kofleriaceae bacterium]
MTCAACVRRVERAVAAAPGVSRAEVNLPLSRARIVLDPAVGSAKSAAAAIRDAGYEVPDDVLDTIGGRGAGEARLAAIARAEQEEARTLRRDATLAIVLAVPLLAIAMAHGIAKSREAMTASVIVQLVLGTIVVLVPGRHYLRRGWIAVAHRSPDMNTLIALGAGTAWLSSTIVAARWLAGPRHHMPEIYFEAGAAIVAFVMIGKLLESRARARLSAAVRGLLSLAPAKAHAIVDGTERDVDAGSLEVGAVIRVRPGERVAADGTVIEGTSAVDEAMLTGESMPVDKDEGSPIYAGTLNGHGPLVVRVARAGADTALARIARAVEDAQGNKAPIAHLADRVSAVFVPAVLAIAALTGAIWLVGGAPLGIALERMVAVLVIACPCALGLATPAAVAVGTARGAELGILFRGGDALETASQIEVVCLDKTGTLTAGTPKVVDGTDDVLRIAAAVEQGSEHPLARAIVAAARERSIDAPDATGVQIVPGGGAHGIVDGRQVRVGSREFVGADAQSPSVDGATRSYVTVDGALAGTISIVDPPAAEARRVVDELRDLRIELVMITGDHEDVARRIAGDVGISRVHAGVKPTGKAQLVEAERTNHRVAMVGDGINDAPALAAADLGVALASGADVAAAAADVTLLRGGIALLPTVFSLARATLRTIRRNLLAAFAYNIVCIPVAAGVLYPWTGWLLSPVLASAAMSLSSVSVLLSSLQLRHASANVTGRG